MRKTNYRERGRIYCEYAEMIREAVAEKYGLDYHPSKCNHDNPYMGFCWKCDEELKDLQRQLDNKGIKDISLEDDIASQIPKEVTDSLWTVLKARISEEERIFNDELSGYVRIIKEDSFSMKDDRLIDKLKRLVKKLRFK